MELKMNFKLKKDPHLIESLISSTKKKGLKFLYKKRNYKAGRSSGSIGCRHRGGSTVKRFLLVNFHRRLFNVLGQVLAIFKDPLRTSFVALVFYKRYGLYEYILAANNIRSGSFVMALNEEIKHFGLLKKFSNYQKYLNNLGNSFFLKHIKVGTKIFNIETFPGSGGKLMKAAGTSAKIVQKLCFSSVNIYVALRVRENCVFYLKGNCIGSIGQSSNILHRKINLKKAGISRKRGFRPQVRGVAMNPVDHPHGGGEGKTSGGRSSVSPWGKLTKGYKTLKFYKVKRRKKFIKKMRFGSSLK